MQVKAKISGCDKLKKGKLYHIARILSEEPLNITIKNKSQFFFPPSTKFYFTNRKFC